MYLNRHVFVMNEKFQMKKMWSFCHFCSKHLTDAVLTGTHNLCFIAEIRKIIYTPANPIFFYIKVGFEGGQTQTDMFSFCGLLRNEAHSGV